jgi:three-Cys-motif partner protein
VFQYAISELSTRRRKSYLEWWMERLNELHGYEQQSKIFYSLTHQANPTDSWAILKLVVIANYTDIYTSIIKSRFEKAYYLETNAGSGLNRIEDVDDIIVFGSAMVAATKPKKKFDGYILIEKNPKYCEALGKLLPNAMILKGDANSDVLNRQNSDLRGLRYALSTIPARMPVLAFVDPFGMDIRWDTLELLLNRWSDVIINFQNVARTVGSISYNPKYRNTLSRFFGTAEWQSCTSSEDYLNLYVQQIKKYKDFTIPIKIQGLGNYHYYLIVAVKKTKGTQGWISAILRVKENVEKATYKDVKKFIDIFRKKQATLF